MTKLARAGLSSLAIAALAVLCFAKTPQFTGKIVAYDLLAHAGKVASFVENKEIFILDSPASKKRYIKVVVQGYGTVQIDPKYFGGVTPLTLRADRDKSCDESSPVIQDEVKNPRAGTYLLTDAYKTSSPPRIKKLECYVAIAPKK